MSKKLSPRRVRREGDFLSPTQGTPSPNGKHPANDAIAIERVTWSLVAIGYDENDARAWVTAKLSGEEPPAIQLPAAERVRVWVELARGKYAGASGEIIPIE